MSFFRVEHHDHRLFVSLVTKPLSTMVKIENDITFNVILQSI